MIKFNRMKIFIGILFFCGVCQTKTINLYFCTAANDKYFDAVMNLIGSIHKTNFDQLEKIAVFDLGLSQRNMQLLGRIKKLEVYSVEMISPDLLKPFRTRPHGDGKPVPGSYSWKPVIIKQALDMFPYFLYLDAGITVLDSLEVAFEYIKRHGYLFINDAKFHGMRDMVTQYMIEQFNLNSNDRKWIIEEGRLGLASGFMGISPKIKDNFVMPMYENAKNIRLFIDDGTAPKGFGWARHDQALFSIYAHLSGLEILEVFDSQLKSLVIDNNELPFCFDTHVKVSRLDFRKDAYTKFIKFY